MKKFIEFINEKVEVGEYYDFKKVVDDYKYILQDEGFNVEFVDAFNDNVDLREYPFIHKNLSNGYNRTILMVSIRKTSFDQPDKFDSDEFMEFIDRIKEELPDYDILVTPQSSAYSKRYGNVGIGLRDISYKSIFHKKK